LHEGACGVPVPGDKPDRKGRRSCSREAMFSTTSFTSQDVRPRENALPSFQKPFILILINVSGFMNHEGLNQMLKALHRVSARRISGAGTCGNPSSASSSRNSIPSGPTQEQPCSKMQAPPDFSTGTDRPAEDLRHLPHISLVPRGCRLMRPFDLERCQGLTKRHARMHSSSRMKRLLEAMGSFAAIAKFGLLSSPIRHRRHENCLLP